MRDINRIPTLQRALTERLADGAERLADETLSQIDRGFRHGQDAMGRPWQPLDPATVAQKGHADILQDTGALRNSFGAEVDHNPVTGHYEVTIYSDDPKLVHHEYGAPDAGLPPRPVLRPAAEWVATQREADPIAAAVNMAVETALMSSGGMQTLTSSVPGGGR